MLAERSRTVLHLRIGLGVDFVACLIVGPRTRRAAKNRSCKPHAAVFAETGWHRATVDAVAERAQVGKGTIYLYFDSKEAILAELVLQALAD